MAACRSGRRTCLESVSLPNAPRRPNGGNSNPDPVNRSWQQLRGVGDAPRDVWDTSLRILLDTRPHRDVARFCVAALPPSKAQQCNSKEPFRLLSSPRCHAVSRAPVRPRQRTARPRPTACPATAASPVLARGGTGRQPLPHRGGRRGYDGLLCSRKGLITPTPS